jgi:rubredoxin
MCLQCGYIYQEALGDPSNGIPPGTPWEEVTHDWKCPDCGAGKEEFDLVEM